MVSYGSSLFALTIALSVTLAIAIDSVDGTYALFNLTKLYLPIGVGFSYANISAQPSAFLSPGGGDLATIGKVVRRVVRQTTTAPFFDGESSFCPKKITLTSSGRKIAYPDGLKDPSGTCKPVPGFKPTEENIVDAGTLVGTFLMDENLPNYIEKKTLFQFSKIPADVLKCPSAPDRMPPFTQLSINYLAQQLVSIIKASGIAMRIPLTILDRVFGKVRQMSKLPRGDPPKGWADTYLSKTTDTLRNALNQVKGTPMMVLKPNSKEAQKSGLQNLECYYVRETNTVKIADLSRRMEGVTGAMVGFMVQSAQKDVDVSGLMLYASDARCGTPEGNNDDFINTIEFPENSPVLPPVGNVQFKVKIDGKLCADASMTRWLDIGPTMSPDDKRTALPNHIVQFFKANSRFGSIASVMLSSILAQLGTLAPAGFSESLQEATTKTAILHIEVNPSQCTSLKNKNMFDLLVVEDYGVSGFLCIPFPGGPGMTTTLCDTPTEGSSAFIVRREDNKPSCLFSSERETSALFLNAGTPRTPVPKPKDTSTTPSAPPVLPKAANKNQVCFPAMATVRTSDGRDVTMYDLRVGDEVEVEHGQFEPVLMFSHASPTLRSDMVMIESSNGTVVASPSHFVYANSEMVAAKSVRVGDRIPVRGKFGLVLEMVTNVKTVSMIGLYNPQTPSGSILVRYGCGQPVLVTTYTTAVAHGTAHSLLGPLRTVYSALGVILPRLSNMFPDTNNVVQGALSPDAHGALNEVLDGVLDAQTDAVTILGTGRGEFE